MTANMDHVVPPPKEEAAPASRAGNGGTPPEEKPKRRFNALKGFIVGIGVLLAASLYMNSLQYEVTVDQGQQIATLSKTTDNQSRNITWQKSQIKRLEASNQMLTQQLEAERRGTIATVAADMGNAFTWMREKVCGK